MILRGVDLAVPGSSNLRLAYLYLRLLSRKLDAECGRRFGVPEGASLTTSSHTLIRRAAEEIVVFVQELDETALGDFWLPLSAFTLSSTITFLLRCAIESTAVQEGLTKSVSFRLTKDMMAALQSHRQCASWDLGDICITQYSHLIEKLAASDSASLEVVPDFEQLMLSDASAIDEFCPSLWDMFNSK
jgi:hypothetical protein